MTGGDDAQDRAGAGREPAALRIARELSADRDALVEEVVQVIDAAIPSLKHEDELFGLLRASVDENVVTMLHMIENGTDPHTIEAPTAAKMYARRLAQRGVPRTALLRAYRLGQATFTERALERLNVAGDRDGPGAPPDRGEASIDVVRQATTYIDVVSEGVIGEYEAEREAWRDRQSAVRATWLRGLLDGRPVDAADVAGSDALLGYRLDQPHVGVLLWFTDQRRLRGDELAGLDQLVRAAAGRLSATHLLLPIDAGSAAAWFGGVPGPDGADGADGADAAIGAALVAVLDEAPRPELRLALGRGASGADGFGRTLLQANRAKSVAHVAAAAAAAVTYHRDVAALALLCADLPALRLWISDTLGELAGPDEAARRLRETVLVFLASGSSYAAAAEQLFLHKNSVQYRVQKAEQLRGRPLRADRNDVELALRACHWLGPAALRP